MESVETQWYSVPCSIAGIFRFLVPPGSFGRNILFNRTPKSGTPGKAGGLKGREPLKAVFDASLEPPKGGIPVSLID